MELLNYFNQEQKTRFWKALMFSRPGKRKTLKIQIYSKMEKALYKCFFDSKRKTIARS